MAHPCFELKKSKSGQFFFNLTAKNGQIIASSEMYNSKGAAENGIRSVKENAPNADTEDKTEESQAA